MNRRHFLLSTGSMVVATSPLLMAAETWAQSPRLIQSAETVNPGLSRKQWKTVTAAQAHLFPSDANAPGAEDVNAKAYLYAVLADARRDDEDRLLVKQGAVALDKISQQDFNGPFILLDETHKEKALRIFENNGGEAWIMTLLGYIFEALLTDPVYGGNPDGVGWQWLQHNPGFPRPTSEQRFFLL